MVDAHNNEDERANNKASTAKSSEKKKVSLFGGGKAASKRQAPSPYTSHVQRLWARLQEEEKDLLLERAKVKDVWLMILDARKKNEEDRKSLNHEGLLDFVEPHTRLTLNVGGQVFETTAEVLTRDKYSVLASLCRKDPSKQPFKPNAQGSFFLDRDWWIFRHILHFLRDGALPEDPPLLQELYSEAIFYQLGSLRRAVENKMQSAISYDDIGRRGQFLDLIVERTTNMDNNYHRNNHHQQSGSRISAKGSSSASPARPSSSSWSPPRHTSSSSSHAHSRKEGECTGSLPDPYGFTR